MPLTASPTEQLQRRTLSTLVTSQVLGGVGTASGIAVMALLTERVSGSEALAGLGTTAQVLGGALLAVPVARVSAARLTAMWCSTSLSLPGSRSWSQSGCWSVVRVQICECDLDRSAAAC